MTKQYKYEEIKAHFEDFINDSNNKDIVENNLDDLHHEILDRKSVV
jgi:hypothetical protein